MWYRYIIVNFYSHRFFFSFENFRKYGKIWKKKAFRVGTNGMASIMRLRSDSISLVFLFGTSCVFIIRILTSAIAIWWREQCMYTVIWVQIVFNKRILYEFFQKKILFWQKQEHNSMNHKFARKVTLVGKSWRNFFSKWF